jgi:hypothetical protein
MNWQKGFWRLWLALSLCWIVVVGVYAWQDRAWMQSRANACFEAKQTQGLNPFECYGGDERIRLSNAPVGLADIAAAAEEYVAVALTPPLIVFGLGLLGAWVMSGFARRGA